MLEILRRGAQSWGIKIVFGAIIAVFILSFGMSRSDFGKSNAVATVNDKSISFTDFQKRLQRALEAARAQNPGLSAETLKQMGFKRQILEQMISEELMQQKADALGITVSNEELAVAIHRIPAFLNDTKTFDPTVYQNVLRANGLNPGQFENDYRHSLVMDKLRAFMGLAGNMPEPQIHDFYAFGRSTAVVAYALYPWEKFAAQVNATDAQIADYYSAHKAEFTVPAQARLAYLLLTPETLADPSTVSDADIRAYYDAHSDKFAIEEQVKARHLLVRVDDNATETDVNKAMDKIKAAQTDLKKGMSFEEVAGKYTEDPSGTHTGGNLDWFTRGRMVKPFEDAAFALDKGAVSAPIRTRFGFHLIKIDDKKAAGHEEFAAVVDQIRNIIAQDRAADTVQDRLDQALEMATSGKDLAAVAKTIGLRLKVEETALFTKDAGPAELPGLNPENLASLFELAVNTTTPSPLRYENGYLLASKREQIAETVKPLEQVKADIKTSVVKTEAMALSKAAAEQALGTLSKGDNTTVTTTDSQAFTRQGFIPGLGMNQALVEAAFLAKPGAWLPVAYEFPNGYALARGVSVTPPADSAWNSEKQMWTSSLNQRAQEQAMQAFLSTLRAKAEIKLPNPALLDN